MSCCVLCFVFPCFKFSCVFSCVLPSVSLCLLVLFPPGFLLCAFPPHYHTWPPPSSLSSLVPHLVINVCCFGLCLPCTPCPVIVCSCLLLFPVPPWYVFFFFWTLNFAFLIWTLLFVGTLFSLGCYFVLLFLCYFVVLVLDLFSFALLGFCGFQLLLL